VPRLLLAGRVSMARLLPAATLMGVGSVGLSIAGQIYLPRALTVAERQFGDLGIAFTMIGWLFVVSFVLVVATVLGSVIVQEQGADGLARRLRSPRPARPHRAPGAG
jgi:membrane protein